MAKTILTASAVLLFVGLFLVLLKRTKSSDFGAPPYSEGETDVPQFGTIPWLSNWERPATVAKVALQVGHWKNNELPNELEKLRGNSGASVTGVAEWEVNLAIAQRTAEILRVKAVNVELLPATVPPSYWADVFLAIHADGSVDRTKSGFKIASPWRDLTKNSKDLVFAISGEYKKQTGFETDPNITQNMRGYYAFSWWKYEHAIHPMTTSAIIETGFLTNYQDRQLLVNDPQIPAQAIADGIVNYIYEKNLPLYEL